MIRNALLLRDRGRGWTFIRSSGYISSMEFRYSTYRIHLQHRFTIARSSHDYYDIVLVYLTDGGTTGMGEAAPSERYDESFEGVLEIVRDFTMDESVTSDSLDEMLDGILSRCHGCRSLEAAFDMALHDLWGKRNGESLGKRFGGRAKKGPATSLTIGLDRLDVVRKKVSEAGEFPVLKVKLGGEQDRELIETVREITDKPLRVDANEGWELEEAVDMCQWLATQNVEFVEQPLPAGRLDDTARLKEVSPLKLIADENCLDSSDIPLIAHAFHGINIKLMKCGGLREGLRMIQVAREKGLEVMIGCMVETSLAITAASYLAGQADYVDLDGNLLIKNDPFRGVVTRQGKLSLPSGAGLGVHLRKRTADPVPMTV
ncbi:MAG: dipeptide epimerase [Fidelibacterota bacterium]